MVEDTVAAAAAAAVGAGIAREEVEDCMYNVTGSLRK